MDHGQIADFLSAPVRASYISMSDHAAPPTSWMTARQNPTPERDLTETNLDLQAVVDAFGQAWLERPDDNPVQQLWRRRDDQATTQLITLGDALRRLTSSFSGFTTDVVKKMKRDAGERRGASFELMTLAAFRAGGHDARPTARSAAGFDLCLDLDSFQLDLSLKNFGLSQHERDARREMAAFKQAYLAARRLDPDRTSGLFLAATRWPEPAEWAALTGAIGEIVHIPTDNQQRAGPGPFKLWKHRLPAVGSFHRHEVSYQIVLATPHHHNEHRNLLSHLKAAADNARKHARPGRQAALMVRLRESADLTDCHAWAFDQLLADPAGPLAAIMFHQPAWSRTSQTHTALHHGFTLAATPSFIAARASAPPLRFAAPIGVTGGNSRHVFEAGDQQFPLGKNYVTQEGRFHLVADQNEATLTTFAPGIETVSHMHVMDGQWITVTAIRPEVHDVVLFD